MLQSRERSDVPRADIPPFQSVSQNGEQMYSRSIELRLVGNLRRYAWRTIAEVSVSWASSSHRRSYRDCGRRRTSFRDWYDWVKIIDSEARTAEDHDWR